VWPPLRLQGDDDATHGSAAAICDRSEKQHGDGWLHSGGGHERLANNAVDLRLVEASCISITVLVLVRSRYIFLQ
jgi:hypothetical protein